MSVRLREVRASDLPVHFEQQRDPDSNALALVPPRDRAAFEEHWRRLLADPGVVLRTVEAGGQVVGSALSFMRDGRREVGYWIGREHWGKGYATAALGQLLELVPDRPLFARVAAHNAASMCVAAKHGFVVVGESQADGARVVVLRVD